MSDFLTLMDLKNRMAPGDASLASVAEVIAQENEALDDIPWVNGNLLTGDVFLKRSAKPRAQVRKINEGIEASASKTEAHTETCIELASRGIVDMSVLKLAPNAAKLLLSENRPHIGVLGEDLCASLFYGADPAGIVGFATRYNKLSSPQVINAEGIGNNLASIYIVKWDPEEVTGIYPKNSTAGLETIPQSNVYVKDKDGKEFLAHVTEYKWFTGLKVRDQRYVARVCNIDRHALLTDEAARQKLFEYLIIAKNKVRRVTQGRVVMYVDPDIFSMLEIAAFQKANLALGYANITGDTRILKFAGIPIKCNDCQAEPEKKVS